MTRRAFLAASSIDEITRAMQDRGRIVPVYQDKYFASDWTDARRTYDVRQMRIGRRSM